MNVRVMGKRIILLGSLREILLKITLTLGLRQKFARRTAFSQMSRKGFSLSAKEPLYVCFVCVYFMCVYSCVCGLYVGVCVCAHA